MEKMTYTKKTIHKRSERSRENKTYRDMHIGSIRAVEGEGNERKFIVSFSSELPYERWFGNEILDHANGCVDLTRLNEIGCVLFNHKRDEVIGKINRAWIENNRGMAEIEMDSDDDAEKIFQKMKSGTLKGVSVGYVVDSWEEIMINKQSSDGRFKGPASIARKWTPFEISIVSVPADPTVGVGREGKKSIERVFQDYERQLIVNKNLMGGIY